MALYLAVLGLMPRHLATSGHAAKKIGRLFPVRGSRPINAPACTPLRQETLQFLTERRGDRPSLPFDKLPQRAAHGHCQVQNAQDDLGTRQFQNPPRTAASGLQRRRTKEEGRSVGLITIFGPRGSTSLPIPLFGTPYPLVERGAHLGTYGHPDPPSCPRLIPPEDHLCLLLAGPQFDEPLVDDVLNRLNTRHCGWFISF